ncbi:MAG: DUF5333 domain-containing protein [Yoonia sp.]|nr:DUF5333 domain-containing protein [Yoonia sp.]
MKKTPALALAICVAVAGLSGAVSAKPALKDVEHVREGIIATGMALEISEKCGSISPRRIRGINYLFSLRSHAFDLGFSRAEVDAYVNDKTEENRLKEIAYGRLHDLGTVSGNEASYCAVGRAEIAKDSAIGRLLR